MKANKDNTEQLKTGIAKRFKNKFTPVVKRKLSEISVRPEIFQGRTVPFAGATVEKIVREGFDTSQEPIVLYRLKQKGKTQDIVISGHSRYEAAKRLKLPEIPVKYFRGNFEDAIDYAIIESNRSGNAEGIESDVKAYLRAKERAYNKEFLRSIFKTDSYIDTLRNLSYLNPKGDFIKSLADQANKSYPYLERNAIWTGNLRFQYNKLSDLHEKEIFYFFYRSGDKKNLSIKKQSFYDAVKQRATAPGFDAKKSLRLTKKTEFDYIPESEPGVVLYKSELTKETALHEEHARLLKLAVEADKIGDLSLAKRIRKQAQDTRDLAQKKHAYILKLRENLEFEDVRLQKGGLF